MEGDELKQNTHEVPSGESPEIQVLVVIMLYINQSSSLKQVSTINYPFLNSAFKMSIKKKLLVIV